MIFASPIEKKEKGILILTFASATPFKSLATPWGVSTLRLGNPDLEDGSQPHLAHMLPFGNFCSRPSIDFD